MSIHRILGIFFRYFYVLRKGPHQLADLFYWPLIDILLWGLTSVWIQNQDLNPKFSLILMTALVFWQIVLRGSLDISVSILQEFWHRNLVNLFSTPVKINEWTLGVILFGLMKLLVSITFGISTVYFLYSLNVLTIGWKFIPFATSLLTFGWTLGFLSASLIIYWGHKVEVFAWTSALLFAPFSAIFYPVSILPYWAQMVSWCLPTTYIFEGMRSILHTGSVPEYYFWVSIALNSIYLTLSVSLFKYMFEKSRVKGLARLE